MYDDPYHQPWLGALDPEPAPTRSDERLRMLVFLDGLLVDTWTEPVEGSPYACLALEARSARHQASAATPVPERARPDHEQVLDWLDSAVGGRTTLLALDDVPWGDDEPDDRPHGTADHPSYDAAVDLLERVALDLFHDEEVVRAAHHLLDRVWQHDRELLASRRTVPQVAGGVLWVVGKANGLFGQAPAVRQMDVQRALWLKQPLSGTGHDVARTLDRLGVLAVPRPWRMPSWEAYADARLLTSGTRRALVMWRDRALEAQRRYHADEEAKGVLPPEAE